MNTSPIKHFKGFAQRVTITEDMLNVDLVDGRSISVPLAWYPRLCHATAAERNNWRLIGRGEGIHWVQLDEDISIDHLLAGLRSHESRRSFNEWLERRTAT